MLVSAKQEKAAGSVMLKWGSVGRPGGTQPWASAFPEVALNLRVQEWEKPIELTIGILNDE